MEERDLRDAEVKDPRVAVCQLLSATRARTVTDTTAASHLNLNATKCAMTLVMEEKEEREALTTVATMVAKEEREDSLADTAKQFATSLSTKSF